MYTHMRMAVRRYKAVMCMTALVCFFISLVSAYVLSKEVVSCGNGRGDEAVPAGRLDSLRECRTKVLLFRKRIT